MDVTKTTHTNTHIYRHTNRRKALEDNSFITLDKNIASKRESKNHNKVTY